MDGDSARREINFDRIAAEYDETRGGVARARVCALDLAGHLPPGDVLEIGVGTGIVAQALRREAPGVRRLAGVDISAEMLERAHERLPGCVVRASAQRLPFPPQRFDGVVAVHVLHLVPDLGATLAEAARVLRPGGRLVAVHGLPEHPENELTRAIHSLQLLRAERADSPAAVRAAAETAGFRCLEQHPTRPRTTRHSPAELVGFIHRRTWSHLWDLTDAQWREFVEPALAALGDLPDPERPRVQEARMTVSVLARD